MDLIKMLTDNLGISDSQAAGGTGLLLDLARKKLDGNDFSALADAIPNSDSLMENLPEASGLGGMLGGLGGMLGGSSGGLGSLVELAGGFSKLDMDSDMIQKFIPVITSFLKEHGGSGVEEILERLLK